MSTLCARSLLLAEEKKSVQTPVLGASLVKIAQKCENLSPGNNQMVPRISNPSGVANMYTFELPWLLPTETHVREFLPWAHFQVWDIQHVLLLCSE